jgi:glutathione S-transferase
VPPDEPEASRILAAMLTVYKFGPFGTAPDMSPFVLKLETWLRMAGIPYRTRLGTRPTMPKGKLPVIDDGGRLIADSSLIIQYLEAKHADPLGEAALTAGERATGTAMKALFENHLYFVGFHLRWAVDDNFRLFKAGLIDYATRTSPPFARPLLPLAAPLILPFVRRKMLRQLHGHGMGRHSHDEILAFGLQGWRAVADFLGDKPVMLGERPSGLDAVAYGFIETNVAVPFDNPVQRFLESEPNLAAYRERMRTRYWAA